jgi:hypothetical protein
LEYHTFQETDQETDYFYCLKDPNHTLTLYGTRDDKYKKQDNAYFKIIVDICSERTRLESDPECSSDEEIDKYL